MLGRHNSSKTCDPPLTPANTTVSLESPTHPTRHSPSLASFFDSPSSSMELSRISQPEICSEESLTSPSLVCELSVPNLNIAEKDSVSRHLVRPMSETPDRSRSIRRGLPKRAMIHHLAQEAASALKDVKLAIHSEVVLEKLPNQSGDIPYRKLATAKTGMHCISVIIIITPNNIYYGIDLKLPPNPGRRASINVNKGRGRGKKLSFAAPTSTEGFQLGYLEKSSRNEKNTQSSSKDGLMFYSRIYSSDSDCEK